MNVKLWLGLSLHPFSAMRSCNLCYVILCNVVVTKRIKVIILKPVSVIFIDGAAVSAAHRQLSHSWLGELQYAPSRAHLGGLKWPVFVWSRLNWANMLKYSPWSTCKRWAYAGGGRGWKQTIFCGSPWRKRQQEQKVKPVHDREAVA